MRVDKMKDELPGRIRGIIARAGLTREDTAAKVGITAATIYKYCSGKTSPQVKILKKICEVCNVTIQEVL
jgi:transcriptional regulator with XRE-family HTH domain